MREKILKTMLVSILIMTLTVANFLLLGANMVSYAAGLVNMEQNTSHKNVEFMAYFKDAQGQKVKNLAEDITKEDLKLYLQVEVKKEGYFNGSISLGDSNFKLKSDILSEGISKIEGNTITLHQIKAGEKQEFMVGIELQKELSFALSLLDQESNISISGIYKDSTEKEIKVTGTRIVRLQYVSPYVGEKAKANLTQEIITNKVFNYQGQDKRIIQVQITSGIEGNAFPIQNTMIEVTVPKIGEKNPEKVLVHNVNSLGTNGKDIVENNWKYDSEKEKVMITIPNEAVDNKVTWNKSAQDTFIVTYVFDDKVTVENQKITTTSEVTLYDAQNTKLKANQELVFGQEEKNSILKTEVKNQEESIYKGKLYEGIDRNLTQTTSLYIQLNEVADQVNISENGSYYIGEKFEAQAPIFYQQTKINSQNMKDILGEEGKITIWNTETNQEITNVLANDPANEDGDFVISYPENVKNIRIQTSTPQKIGKLDFITTKTIQATSTAQMIRAKEIVESVKTSYVSQETENSVQEQTRKISLQETQTQARLEINKTELSTMTTNKNVEMRVILQSKNENHELFKNPVIRIELPEKIENIHVNATKLLYENELKIKSAVLAGHVIEIQLEGEQTQYKEEAIEGATLIITADFTTNRKATSSTEQVKMTYTNEKAIHYAGNANQGEDKKDISIVSYAGVITTNAIPHYNLEAINNEGEKQATVPVGSEAKQATITGEVINNQETPVTDVKILGTFPTKEAKANTNNMKVKVASGIQVEGMDLNRVKVYYSEHADATEDLNNSQNEWKENIENAENVKKYLVMMDQLEVSEGAKLSYQVTIPENLEYNATAEQGYEVYYTNMTSVEQNIKAAELSLTTGAGPVAETSLTSMVGGTEKTEAKTGEVIRYQMTVRNTGTEDVTNIKLQGNVPEGTSYIERNSIDYQNGFEGEYASIRFTEKDTAKAIMQIDHLAKGETKTLYYEVKVKENIQNNLTISNTIKTTYNGIEKDSNTISHTLKKGDLILTLISVSDDGEMSAVKNVGTYLQSLEVKNTSNQAKQNVQIEISLSDDILSTQEIWYSKSDNMAKVEKNTNKIVIDKIEANESIIIGAYVKVKPFMDQLEKQVVISAQAKDGQTTYDSNQEFAKATTIMLNLTNTSLNQGQYVALNDVIEYEIKITNPTNIHITDLKVKDILSGYLKISEIQKDGQVLTAQDYQANIAMNKKEKTTIEIPIDLKANTTITIKVKGIVNARETTATEINNLASVNLNGVVVQEAEEVKHIIQPSQITDPEDPNNPNNPNNPDDPDSPELETKVISGVAWLDENENGMKDSGEELLQGISVKILETETNEMVKDMQGNEITAKTNADGFYSLENVPVGEYIVIFEYDTAKYNLTIFEKEGVSEQKNSNVINKNMTINGEEKTVGSTQVITLQDINIANINIGLQIAKNFDLKLDKYINKIIVQNSKGTKTYEYDEATIAKAEIDAKLLNGTNVIVEYKMKVTNVGEVEGYVRKIADYLSTEYKFSSELNKDWYQSENTLYNATLANEKIKPGETKEVTLTVTKKMTENNTGLINNTAEIVEDYNELGLADINSIPGNKLATENDMGSADVFLSIKTGQVVTTITLILSTIIIIGAGAYFVARIVLRKKII